MKKTITEIPATKPLHGFNQMLRVAAYCRVSTGSEEQEHSLESQIQHYTARINANPKWECVGIFADTGSGKNTKKRPNFEKLMKLCWKRKIDIILTKSVSRFGRNTLDALKILRKLKLLGIDVWFETEGMRLQDVASFFDMEVMIAIAQGESESKSSDIKWGLRRSFREPDGKTSHFLCYGYMHDKDKKLIPNGKEAEIVKLMFNLRSEGYSLRKIAIELEYRNVASPTGKLEWSAATLDKLLSNEKYTGDVILHKTVVDDFFSGKQIRNIGQHEHVIINNHHEAIISRKLFDKVQKKNVGNEIY